MCHDWLSIDAYNKTYHHFIQPVQGAEYWARTQYIQPIPPHKKVQRGRPKKNRRRDADEEVIGHRVKRKLPDFTCGRCGQTNHNIRSCNNIGVPIRPKGYVAQPEQVQHEEAVNDPLLAQDEEALNEVERAEQDANQVPPIPVVEEGQVEINLSQPNMSQDNDIEFMVIFLLS